MFFACFCLFFADPHFACLKQCFVKGACLFLTALVSPAEIDFRIRLTSAAEITIRVGPALRDTLTGKIQSPPMVCLGLWVVRGRFEVRVISLG